MTINFGRISGRRIISFRVSDDGMVWPAKCRSRDMQTEVDCDAEMITARESFRRWKIARKAWRTRKERGQLRLL